MIIYVATKNQTTMTRADSENCCYKIEKLPNSDFLFEKTKKDSDNTLQTNGPWASIQHDHDYFGQAWNLGYVDGGNSFMQLNENKHSLDSTCDSDDDMFYSFSDDDYSSEDDSMNENDDEICDKPYLIDYDAMDSDEENLNNTNAETVNRINEVNAGDGEKGKQSNVMDENRLKSFSANSNSDDEDEEMRFLNGISEILKRNGDTDTCSANRYDNGDVWPSNRIFGEICVKFLDGKCYLYNCQFPHRFPSKSEVESQLKLTSSSDQIEEVQNKILLRHECLLLEYFSVFCTFYGRKWQKHRESLRQLIATVSQRLPSTGKSIKNMYS